MYGKMDGDEDFGLVCICAIRYALGRQTYAPGIVTRWIAYHLDKLSVKDLSVIAEDLARYDYTKDEWNGDIWKRFRERVMLTLKRKREE